ncbi:MAG: hypothetical protein H6741_33710 [Alphaproteobacteria bacterium]|nr:hypothetical protein [Alphaproteobacteria bacterium]MCB9797674.1 hypothetical protein [Alphaproteobacteria bacterium]
MTLAWRDRLLLAVLASTTAGYIWIFWDAPRIQPTLALMSAVFTLGSGVTLWHYRAKLTAHLVSAYLALGSIVHVTLAGVVALGARVPGAGLLPTLQSQWGYLMIGLVGIGASFFTWTKARGEPEVLPPQASDPEEPAPEPAPALESRPDWEALAAGMEARGDAEALAQLRALQRVARILEGEQPARQRLVEAQRTLHQEAMRLSARAAASARVDDDDVLSQAAELLEWGVQKLPELAELDLSDLMMGKAVADIRALHSSVERVFIDHHQLRAIHPIDRATANAKCDERAAAARAALPLLQANGLRLSEDLIQSEEALAELRSVTGFQVIDLGGDEGYVTFEGNGRREALKRAFAGEALSVLVECRLYRFADPKAEEDCRRRVRRVRRWKGVVDD